MRHVQHEDNLPIRWALCHCEASDSSNSMDWPAANASQMRRDSCESKATEDEGRRRCRSPGEYHRHCPTSISLWSTSRENRMLAGRWIVLVVRCSLRIAYFHLQVVSDLTTTNLWSSNWSTTMIWSVACHRHRLRPRRRPLGLVGNNRRSLLCEIYSSLRLGWWSASCSLEGELDVRWIRTWQIQPVGCGRGHRCS